MTRSRVALSIGAVAIALVIATLVVFPGTYFLRRALIAVSFAAIGGFVAAKRPRNPVGWLLLGFGAVMALGFAAERYAHRALVTDPGSLPGGDVAASLAVHSGHPAFGFLVLALLLFPNGRLLSPRWRWVVRAALVVYGGLALSAPFDADFLHDDIPQADPLVHGTAADIGSAVFGMLLLVNLVLLLVAGVSLVLRLRRSRGEERQQVKWFVVPVAFTMLAFPISVVAVGSGRIGIYLFPLIPASAGVAILRYRLYDIDVVINRTLVYGALSGLLVGAYLASVLLLQLVLSPSSDLAIAGSTLAVAALFRPARARIQDAVDRRFYRRRYDAQRTLEVFAARLRDEVSLDALSRDLRDVVGETMQPAHVSIWLRAR